MDEPAEDLVITEPSVPVETPATKLRVIPRAYDEFARLTIALILLGLLIATFLFANYRPDSQWEHTKELLQIYVPVVSGLLGSAVGFYFGSKKAGS